MFIICGPKVPASISLNLLTSATSCKCCALANGEQAVEKNQKVKDVIYLIKRGKVYLQKKSLTKKVAEVHKKVAEVPKKAVETVKSTLTTSQPVEETPVEEPPVEEEEESSETATPVE